MNAALGEDNPLTGLLGKAIGETPFDQTARVEEAKRNARDLSGLVRKKAKEQPTQEPEETNGKRKAEEPVEGEEEAKKTKVEESTAQA